MKKLLLSLCLAVSLFFNGFAAEDPVTLSWSFKVKQTINTKQTSPFTFTSINTPSGTKGAWTLTFTGDGISAQNDATNGPRFGSTSSPLPSGTALTLSNSEIPGNATITKVKFTAKGNAKTSTSTWKVSVNGVESSETKSFSVGNSENSIEWTDLNLTGNEIVLTATSITAGIQFAGVSVTYTEGGGGVVTPVELGDIVATCGTTVFEHDGVYENLVEGDVLAFSCENAETITVTNSESATLASNTAGSECSWTATPTEAEELTVTATLGETSKSIIFMIAVAEKGDTPEPTPGNGGWYKVTSNSDIEAGGRYIIAVTGTLKNNTTNQAVSTEVSTNNRKVTSITLNSDKSQIIDPSESVMTFILEKDGADYLWKAENYQNNQEVNYLYGFTGASAANRMMCGNPQTANVDRRNTSISIGDNGNATITFVNCAKDEVNYVVYFNDNTSGSGGNCFNSYCKTNDNYFPVQLYKYVVEETPESPAYPTAQVDDAAYDSDEAISLDGKERVVVTLSHADSENHAIFYKFVGQATPAAQAEDNNDGFTEYSEPIVIKEAGTLQYYAQHKTSGVKSETRSISFTGVTTSVSEIEVAGVEAEYYDLSGRRIEAPVKGIVIKKTGSKVSKYVF